MSLQERVYSVLLVSSGDKFNHSLMELLPESSFYPVRTVSSISAARRILAEQAFDVVIINAPLPDDFGTRFAIDACTARGAIVMLLVRSDIHDEIYSKVMEYGIFTLPKPTSRQVMTQALLWIASAREGLRRHEKKTQTIEEKMKDIRLVNHAKWLLISQLKMTEPDAHHYIEKLAMDQCISRRQVAEDIIKTYSL